MSRLKGLHYTCCSALLASALAACEPAKPAAANGQTPPADPLANGLIYCAEGNPETFNPQLDTSGTTVDATAAQLYDRLLDYEHTQQTFVPALATSWQVLDEGTRYRFKLRSGVAFHTTEWFSPTRTFNAEDVIFSFRRWLQSEHPFHEVGGGQYPYFNSSGLANLISHVEQVDSTTVDFYLRRPDSSFLANLATDYAVILSAEYGQQLAAAGTKNLIDSRPIGTGPFIFDGFRKDVLIRYQRNPDYWRTPAALDQLVYAITTNANKRMLKLLTGECDVIPYPLVNELQLLDSEAAIEVSAEVSPNVGYWAFNTEREPFDQPLVRQALAHAINRQALVDTIYGANAEVAQTLVPPTSWAYHEPDQSYSYDPDRARDLLADAGYANGFTMTIWAMPVQRAYNPNAQRMAELMQADLAAVGVTAQIVSYEWNTFRQRLALGEHDSVLIGWVADHADPDNFYRPLLSCAARGIANRSNYCSAELDSLLRAAISETEQAERRIIYKQIQGVIRAEVPLLPIAHSLRFQAHQQDIVGVELPPYGGINFRHARRLAPDSRAQSPQEQP